MLETPFVLGAAQLGMAYGVANHKGDLNQSQVDDVLDSARQSEVRFVDTAASYGESEERIGRFLSKHPVSGLDVISKLSGNVDPNSESSVTSSVVETNRRLGQAPWAILLHNPSHLKHWRSGLGQTLEKLKTQGKFDRIGVSVYSPIEFQEALDIQSIACIQAPYSVFDRRLLSGGLLSRAHELGKVLFFRSIFLQGLLLMPETEVKVRFGEESPHFLWIKKWMDAVKDLGRTPAEIAIGFVRATDPNGYLVLGCETKNQVHENAAILRKLASQPLSKSELDRLAEFSFVEPQVYDPRLWQKS